jgi:hypothetical protein
MSRKDEFHILALVVAWRALLEAPRFGVLRKAWQAQPRGESSPRKNMHFEEWLAPQFAQNEFGEKLGWLGSSKMA